MSLDIRTEISRLEGMTVTQLRRRYGEVFGEPTGAHHRAWLVKRIAWRLQSLEQGDLSERARQRAAELANDADLRLSPPKPPRASTPRVVTLPAPPPVPAASTGPIDDRLPPAGTVLTRKYKGKDLQVRVRSDGFEFEGQLFPSLSAVAKAITGSHCNGFTFFKLTRKETQE